MLYLWVWDVHLHLDLSGTYVSYKHNFLRPNSLLCLEQIVRRAGLTVGNEFLWPQTSLIGVIIYTAVNNKLLHIGHIAVTGADWSEAVVTVYVLLRLVMFVRHVQMQSPEMQSLLNNPRALQAMMQIQAGMTQLQLEAPSLSQAYAVFAPYEHWRI